MVGNTQFIPSYCSTLISFLNRLVWLGAMRFHLIPSDFDSDFNSDLNSDLNSDPSIRWVCLCSYERYFSYIFFGYASQLAGLLLLFLRPLSIMPPHQHQHQHQRFFSRKPHPYPYSTLQHSKYVYCRARSWHYFYLPSRERGVLFLYLKRLRGAGKILLNLLEIKREKKEGKIRC